MNITFTPDAACARLGVTWPVRFDVVEHPFMAPPGVMPSAHGAHSVEDGVHVIVVNMPSFGHCRHDVNETVLHELVHAAQAERYGPDRRAQAAFMADYNAATAAVGYEDNPFEVEARRTAERMTAEGYVVTPGHTGPEPPSPDAPAGAWAERLLMMGLPRWLVGDGRGAMTVVGS